MKAFRAKDGIEWDVVVGRESWGTVVAMFISRAGNAPPRQTVLEAISADNALEWVRELSADQLQDLFDKAELKPTE